MPPAGTALGLDALDDPHANAAVPHGLVAAAAASGGRTPRVEVLPWRSERSVVSTGMIHSSARDMAQWMMLHLSGGEYRGRRLISRVRIALGTSMYLALRAAQLRRTAILPFCALGTSLREGVRRSEDTARRRSERPAEHVDHPAFG